MSIRSMLLRKLMSKVYEKCVVDNMPKENIKGVVETKNVVKKLR